MKAKRTKVDYESWYNPWMKLLARSHTRAEIEKRLGLAAANGKKATTAHERAIKATHSMQSNSQRRAQMGNLSAACGDEMIALRGALEIHDLFPEHAKAQKRLDSVTGHR